MAPNSGCPIFTLHPQRVERPALRLLLAEVIPGSRRTQWAQTAGRRFFTCGRANLGLTITFSWTAPFTICLWKSGES